VSAPALWNSLPADIMTIVVLKITCSVIFIRKRCIGKFPLGSVSGNIPAWKPSGKFTSLNKGDELSVGCHIQINMLID